jgi:hypothetical protein
MIYSMTCIEYKNESREESQKINRAMRMCQAWDVLREAKNEQVTQGVRVRRGSDGHGQLGAGLIEPVRMVELSTPSPGSERRVVLTRPGSVWYVVSGSKMSESTERRADAPGWRCRAGSSLASTTASTMHPCDPRARANRLNALQPSTTHGFKPRSELERRASGSSGK